MLAGTVIVLIRHGEKPGDPCAKDQHGDTGLSPAGVARSQAYASYFAPLALTASDGSGSRLFKPDHLFAALSTGNSHRPKLTLEPLHRAQPTVPFNHGIPEKQIGTLRSTLMEDTYDNTQILICWHHGEILNLANALLSPTIDPPPTTPPQALPTAAAWPSKHPCDVFGWAYQIVYDADGQPDLSWVRCYNEKLMPDDTKDPPDGHTT